MDEISIFIAILRGVFMSHGNQFNDRARDNTEKVVRRRYAAEGLGFLTKTLPRLGKSLDKALALVEPLNASKHRLAPMKGSKLPKLFGELFSEVLNVSGEVLPNPCTKCVRALRELCYVFYKYELPYSSEQEQVVIQKFVRTEEELLGSDSRLGEIRAELILMQEGKVAFKQLTHLAKIAVRARSALSELFASDGVVSERKEHWNKQPVFRHFDPWDIIPRHGPGAVSTGEKLWEKWRWKQIPTAITDVYPLDAYFYASLGHVCDAYRGSSSHEVALVSTEYECRIDTPPAKVVLVPKDSRGPRLISCECLANQFIQQGLGRAITEWVEHHPLTRYNVRFTDQGPNGFAAIQGSKHGRYATLDLNEASDRVSLELVRLLFPEWLIPFLECCRSHSTMLPSGQVIKLRKFAPMGSALCFPILALTVWSLAQVVCTTREEYESLYVYGDDVITPTARAEDIMNTLESFGLKINRDKSCFQGFFRESCGVDAFKGIDVTPVRLRTVWNSSTKSADEFVSWVEYSNSLYELGYYEAADVIASELVRKYGPIPSRAEVGRSAPALLCLDGSVSNVRRRRNERFQNLQYLCLCPMPATVRRRLDEWSMIHRFLSERDHGVARNSVEGQWDHEKVSWNQSSLYTHRRRSMLRRRWR